MIRNIVVIGGTGTGKSSFLNNLALILRYATLEEAAKDCMNFEPPIPVKLVFNEVEIVEGWDANERDEKASSRTRRPQIYRIKCGTIVFNLIDTPGMADSGGQEMDHEHVKNITTCLGQFQQIHGILALLKASDNTLNFNLKYTLNMVLSCLGKTAGKMISFGLTHCGFNKDPGAAPNCIQQYLKTLTKNPGIDCSKQNIYCFESKPLFHVLSTKKGAAVGVRETQVFGYTYENNVDELHKFLSMVYHRKDSYNVLNISTLIIAKHVQPALASLLPYLDSKDEEIKRELDRLEKELLTKGSEYAQNLTKLKQIREWREEYQVTKTRVEMEAQKVMKQRIVPEEYMSEEVDLVPEIGPADSSTSDVKECLSTGITVGSKWGPVGTAVGAIVGALFGLASSSNSQQTTWRKVTKQVPKVRPTVQDYEGEMIVPVAREYIDTEYRDRYSIEEDPVVKRILTEIEEEKRKLQDLLTQNATMYENFQSEKKMVLSLLSDLTSYLEEHAIIAFDDTGLGLSENSSARLSSRIAQLKISGQWNPTSRNIGPEELIGRLTAMKSFKHFGNEIKSIISECEKLENVKYPVVNIKVHPNNAFINKIVTG